MAFILKNTVEIDWPTTGLMIREQESKHYYQNQQQFGWFSWLQLSCTISNNAWDVW